MSAIYYSAIVSTALGFTLLILLVFRLHKSEYASWIQAFILFIAILLIVWGIDALVHLEEF